MLQQMTPKTTAREEEDDNDNDDDWDAFGATNPAHTFSLRKMGFRGI